MGSGIFCDHAPVGWGGSGHHTATATPPPAFATTSTETIDFSIEFGFAALIYVSL
jgi:hypothetical protein